VRHPRSSADVAFGSGNNFYFALWTFTMGCLLGWLKAYGRSTWIPVAGHAFFDLVVYGDKMVNAWWIWM
jgi:membrane protease YdiL (CAAX protease family)